MVLPTSPLLVRYRQVSDRAAETAEAIRARLPLVWHLDLDDGAVVFTFNKMVIDEPAASALVRGTWQEVDPAGQHLAPT